MANIPSSEKNNLNYVVYFVLLTLHFILAPIGECFVTNQCFFSEH